MLGDIMANYIYGYLSSEDTFVPIDVDSSTHTLQSIEYEHHEIHAGSYYRAGFQKDIPNGETAVFTIKTPNTTKWLHFRPAVDVELEAAVELFENPTSISGGTSIIPRNANRNISDLSVATVIVDPTSIDLTGAVQLGNVVEGSGKSSGGESSAQFEWVLKQNTTYILRVTNQTTSTNEVNIRCMWYEHTDKGL